MKKSYLVVILVVVLLAAYLMLGKNDVETVQNQAVELDQAAEMVDQEELEAGADKNESEEATEPIVESKDDSSEDMAEGENTEHIFTLDSFNFGYSETELRVKEGDTVTINLTNSDGFHDWVVDEFSAATEKIRAGDTTSVTFVANQTGTFEYYCSVGSHRANGMVGTLIVE